DGMTIDVEGNLWVALWGDGTVVCVDPGSGRELERVEVEGATQTSACTFGGPDLDRLYITTSDQGGSGGQHAGAVFVATPGARGGGRGRARRPRQRARARAGRGRGRDADQRLHLRRPRPRPALHHDVRPGRLGRPARRRGVRRDAGRAGCAPDAVRGLAARG